MAGEEEETEEVVFETENGEGRDEAFEVVNKGMDKEAETKGTVIEKGLRHWPRNSLVIVDDLESDS